MLKDLISRHQKVALPVAVGILVYIGYQFSFKKTIAAVLLNHQLNSEVNTQDIGVQSTLNIMEQKQLAYAKILKTYAVKKEDRENKMWQVISGLALQNQVSISFKPIKLETDTGLAKNSFQQEYQFNGDYVNLVRLLDTLHHVPEIGRLAKVKLFKDQKNTGNKRQLTMELEFVGLEK